MVEREDCISTWANHSPITVLSIWAVAAKKLMPLSTLTRANKIKLFTIIYFGCLVHPCKYLYVYEYSALKSISRKVLNSQECGIKS